MKNEVVTVVSVLLLLCLQFLPGSAGFPKHPCCDYDHDKCTVFEEDGNSVCERSNRVVTQNNDFRELSTDGTSVKLLPGKTEVEFHVATCKPIECDREDYQYSSSSGYAVDTDCIVEKKCEDSYQGQSFLFMNIPFQLNGSNITSVEFYINASSPKFDKFIYATHYAIEVRDSHRFEFQGETTFHLSGVGTFLKTGTSSKMVAVLPGVNYSVRAYSPNAGYDHVDITVPDCHHLTGILSSNYHCGRKSHATFTSNVSIDLAEQREGVVRVIFKVKTETDWYPSFVVQLRRLPEDEIVEEVELQNEPEFQRVYTSAYPYPHMIHSFRDIAVGTYIVTVQPTINPKLINDWHYVYWGGKTLVTRSKEFHLRRPKVTPSPQGSISPPTSTPSETLTLDAPSLSEFTTGRRTSPTKAPPLQGISVSNSPPSSTPSELFMSDAPSSSGFARGTLTPPMKAPPFQSEWPMMTTLVPQGSNSPLNLTPSDISSSGFTTDDTLSSQTKAPPEFQEAVVYIAVAVVIVFVLAFALVFFLLRWCDKDGDDNTTVKTGNPLTLFEPYPLNVPRISTHHPFWSGTIPDSSRYTRSVVSWDETTVAESLLGRVP